MPDAPAWWNYAGLPPWNLYNLIALLIWGIAIPLAVFFYCVTAPLTKPNDTTNPIPVHMPTIPHTLDMPPTVPPDRYDCAFCGKQWLTTYRRIENRTLCLDCANNAGITRSDIPSAWGVHEQCIRDGYTHQLRFPDGTMRYYWNERDAGAANAEIGWSGRVDPIQHYDGK